ncbi:MAG: UDP-N-acetylmuramoyl-L-alanine--D-glutamate ligase [Heliobacteriaceae bacterium]|nr:UDP-N-acetylmuramoyl-L-alanine--D-glutamate ligase [Heliobacteriaceae bacterium]
MKKVLVLGLSKSGISAAKYLNSQGADVFITEKRTETPEDKTVIEELTALGIKIETGGHEKALQLLAAPPRNLPKRILTILKGGEWKLCVDNVIARRELARRGNPVKSTFLTGLLRFARNDEAIKSYQCPQGEGKPFTLVPLGIQTHKAHSSPVRFVNPSTFQLAVTSPGIPPHSEIIQRVKSRNIPVISEIELAYTQTDKPFIAITGTNGKTTVTALTAHILGQDFKAAACGNYGIPPCSLLEAPPDYFVCECSSYQLEMSPNFTPYIAVWTNFTPDHLDWHEGEENYFNAKAKMFKSPDFAVLNALDKRLLEFAKVCGGEVFLFGADTGENCAYVKDKAIFYKRNNVEEKIIRLADCPMIGEHNYQNIMCAVICAKLAGVQNNKIVSAVKSFKVPEHRMEKFASFNGIDFYNDSKATNPEAAIVAVKSFDNSNVVLIAGGRDKNTDLTGFCNEVKKHITSVILIGEAAQRFEENLKKNGFTNIERASSTENAVDRAIALKPDAVLLSPACASFDMYSGYEERGKVFKEYVQKRLG